MRPISSWDMLGLPADCSFKTLPVSWNCWYHLRIHLSDLCTDHSVLPWLMSFKNLKGQTALWIQRLQEYNFTSEYRQGRKHNSADALSQRACQEECIHCHKVEMRAHIRQVHAIAAVAVTDWDLGALKTELNDQDIGPGSRDRTASRVGRHHRPQPRVRKLRGPMEITRCEERQTRAPLEIRRRTIKSSPNNSLSEQSERCAYPTIS
jgi:hypothetical protein